MTKFKKIWALLTSLVLLLSVLSALSACTEPDEGDGGTPCTSHVDNNGDGVCDSEGCDESVAPEQTGPVTYKVTVRDYFGNIPEGSFVLEVDTGAENTVKARLRDGVASLTLDRGEYTFFINTDGKYVYDAQSAVWTPDSREAEIVFYSPTVAGPSIGVVCTEHTDSNTDGDCRCDLCGLTLPTSHVNVQGNDCVCDVCDEVIDAFHEDNDGDCACDTCSSPYHPDLGGDRSCDNCGTPLVNLDGLLEGRRYVTTTGVSVGATSVALVAGDMTYFIFTPTVGGIYKFSCVAEGESSIGYYGAPHFVQKENTATIVDGAFRLTIPESAINEGAGGTAQYVIGIRSESTESAVLVIEREDDVPEELPFVDVRAESGAVKYDDPLNDGLVDIDVTKAVTVVYNEDDGYYHYGSADGPLVLVKITACGNSNLPDFAFASFLSITETDRLCYYFYEGDTVVRKESYNVMIEDYAALAGSRGLVPLDKTLADSIKKMGEHNGWWEKGGVGYIFGDVSVNAESAWLFACSYVSPDLYGSSASPIGVRPEEGKSFAVRVDADSSTYLKIIGSVGGSFTVTLSDPTGTATASVGSMEYTDTDSDGVITFDVAVGTVIVLECGTDALLTFTCE
ncbi:MAG: hypothetical protein IJD51_00485 [Clostridia bacterium]|nr:hypothetical protein [Clostridia bacterium]